MASIIRSPVPPPRADFATVWAFLEQVIDNIMTRPHVGIAIDEYSISYSVVCNYCTSYRLLLHNSSVTDLYDSLSRYFVQHVRHLRDYSHSFQNELLLKYYAAEWDRYTKGANYINRLSGYLNQHHIKHQRNAGRTDIYPIYTLALVQWHANFFLHIQRKESTLASAILCLIERQRNGEAIDEGLVKKVLGSFVTLGINESDLKKASLDNYKEQFEIPFLVATEAYYKYEPESFVAENSVSDYLKRVEQRLEEEEGRVERYLHPTTRTTLFAKCEHVLVRDHAALMWENFWSFLDYDKDEDLQRMYSLLSRIPEGLEPLWGKFEEYVTRTGLAAVSKLVGTDPAAIEAIEPRAYVGALLQVHTKYSEVVRHCLKGDAGFLASLDKACREFVNRNAATTSPRRSSELLAKHADELLRKNNKVAEEGDLDVALNRVMTILEYLAGKDDFRFFYWRRLANRLLLNVSASDKAEANMISKLEKSCGFGYANKFQRMFTDMSLSKKLTDSFKEHMDQNHNDIDITFSIAVLGSTFWPINPPEGGFIVPTDIELTYDRFQKYYQRKHSGRKLTWLWGYSGIWLRANYSNKKYMFFTSAYQMAVLLQYNDNDRLSLDKLAAEINLRKDSDLLTQALQSLVKSRVLINNETDQYDFNPHFTSKKICVNLKKPVRVGLKAEFSAAVKTEDKMKEDENRKYVIQATIVRIMKVRKTMETQTLIQEVISQISQQFVPRIPDIKKAINTLLEKEYIERLHVTWHWDSDILKYVP